MLYCEFVRQLVGVNRVAIDRYVAQTMSQKNVIVLLTFQLFLNDDDDLITNYP